MAVDIAKIIRTAVEAAFNSVPIGPSEGAPEISIDIETYKSIVEEAGSEAVAEIITGRQAKITIKTKNIDNAITLVNAFKKGDDIYAAANSKALALTPIASGAKILTFPNAFVQPSLSYTPKGDEDHIATLVFIAREQADGTLFTWLAGA